MKIVSFLPSGTEIVYLLGLEKKLVGVTDECDFPPAVRHLPKVVTRRFDSKKLSPQEIDQLVSDTLKKGESLYQINEQLLFDLKPDIIITQDLCQVCAPSGNEAALAIKKLPKNVEVLYLTPKTFDEVLENILTVGKATETEETAKKKVQEIRERVAAVRSKTQTLPKRKVFMMEWVSPVYCAGHWLPEMVEIAGGTDALAKKNQDSVRISWEEVARYDPDYLVISPCGYHLTDATQSAEELLPKLNGLEKLSAFRNHQIFVVDADSYFVRPGPRLITGIEILSEIFHPEVFSGTAPKHSFQKLKTCAGAIS